uniref:Glycosyltransferase family 92 protein n=1 Tax=Panagrolaimus sp. PS1159 TaxID=55785 RepID=A0AC35GNH1_9BILA
MKVHCKYQSNTAAILFNAEKYISLNQKWKCISVNSKGQKVLSNTRPRHAYRSIRECRWTTFIATCQTVKNPISLEFAVEETTANLPLRYSVKERLPVVACFSPLFFNERWQMIALSVESYASSGVSKQAYYIMSVLKDVYDILKEYEKQKMIDINFWGLPRHPNARNQLDWRNQAAAHADCYLKYREAAEFIIISDVDDFLFPRQGSDIYTELEIMARTKPKMASFFYPRFESEIIAAKTFKNFNIAESLKSIRISDKRQTGKSIHRTALVETVWIHWADLKKNNAPYHKLDPADNAFIHVRNWTFLDKYDDVRLLNNVVYGYRKHPYYPDLTSIVPTNFIPFLEKRFNARFSSKYSLHNLTSSEIYYDKINECYDGMLEKVADFYRYPYFKSLICPTPARCSISAVPNLPCAVAQGIYKTIQLADNFFIDYLISRHKIDIIQNGCIIN